MSTELKETVNLAGRVSGILAKQTGGMVGLHHVEKDSFDLSLNGEKYAGGSYYVSKGRLILASVTPQIDLGSVKDIYEIQKNLEAIK